MKMEIKKYKKTDELNFDHAQKFLDTVITYNEVDPSITSSCGIIDNVMYQQTDSSLTQFILNATDIRKLMKWQMGQDEYQENNQKHEDKIREEQKPTSDFDKNRKLGENLNKAYESILECKKLTQIDLTSNVEKKREQAENLIQQYDIKLDLLESIKNSDPMLIGFTSVNPVELSKDYNTTLSDNNKNNQKIVDMKV